jgi:glycosyltransferase involved in cell wall biosynthesis
VDAAKIRVVPLGVDRSVFHEGVVADRLDPDTTVFFNVGKWEVRKGHDLLCSAFNRAFGRSDKVALRLLTYNQYLGEAGNAEWAARYKGSKLGDRITIYPKLPTQADVARFMMAGDVGVFPARSEGWNLDLLEALSLGKHVIATDYSAHTEFCGPHNAALIPVREMVPANDGWWFHGEGTWADPDEDVLVEHMRAAHRLKQAGGSLANAAGIATAKALSWENAAARLAEAVPAT